MLTFPPLRTSLFNQSPHLHPIPHAHLPLFVPPDLTPSLTCPIAHSVPRSLRSLRSLGRRATAYFVAFGPHGPRTPTNPPGHSMRVLGGVGAAVLAAIGLLSF